MPTAMCKLACRRQIWSRPRPRGGPLLFHREDNLCRHHFPGQPSSPLFLKIFFQSSGLEGAVITATPKCPRHWLGQSEPIAELFLTEGGLEEFFLLWLQGLKEVSLNLPGPCPGSVMEPLWSRKDKQSQRRG